MSISGKVSNKDHLKNNKDVFSSQCAQLKAEQKDEKIINLLFEKTHKLFTCLFSIDVTLKNQSLVRFIIETGYFILTTAQSIKTLGQEYTNVWPVKKYKNSWFLLSLFDRLQLFFLKIVIPNLLPILFNNPTFNLRNPLIYFFVFLKQFYLHYFDQTRITLLFISKINLMVWYFNARYLTFPKRLLGIRLVSEGKENVPHLTYVFPGLLLLLECFIGSFIWFYTFFSSKNNFSSKTYYKSPVIESFKKNICQICLAPRFRPTSTLCGHIFCWHCVCEALRKINKCPICRQKIKLQELICLIQYI